MNKDKNKGDIAKALKIIRDVDRALTITGDTKVFDQANPEEVRAVSNSLLVARTAAKNLLRKLGYHADGVGFPPSQGYRG